MAADELLSRGTASRQVTSARWQGASWALIGNPTNNDITQNYEYNSIRVVDTDSFDFKIDHNATDNDRLSVRYSFQRPVTFDPSTWGDAGGPHGGGFQVRAS
jgi:hypothetical protein